MDVQLKSCPFCGGDAWYWNKHTEIAELHFVSCCKCSARVLGSSKDGAINYWNRRVYEL